jgi:plasmid stability protein
MPTSKTIPIEPEQHLALKIRAAQEGRSIQEVTHDAIAAYLATPTGKRTPAVKATKKGKAKA